MSNILQSRNLALFFFICFFASLLPPLPPPLRHSRTRQQQRAAPKLLYVNHPSPKSLPVFPIFRSPDLLQTRVDRSALSQHHNLTRPTRLFIPSSCPSKSTPSSSPSAVRPEYTLAQASCRAGFNPDTLLLIKIEPFTVEVAETLRLKNSGSSPLAFKVRTPRRFVPLAFVQDLDADGFLRSKLRLPSSMFIEACPHLPFPPSPDLVAYPTSRYCVRPNSGRIEPGHDVEVSGTLYDSVFFSFHSLFFGVKPSCHLVCVVKPLTPSSVAVLLQAMKQDPAPDARCRDKFLVQSVAILGDQEFTNVQQIVRY